MLVVAKLIFPVIKNYLSENTKYGRTVKTKFFNLILNASLSFISYVPNTSHKMKSLPY